MHPSSHLAHTFAPVAVAGVGAISAAAIAAGAGCTVLTNDALPDDAGVFEGGDANVATCPACVASQCTAAWALCLTDDACLQVRSCAASTDATSCACDPASDGGLAAGHLYRTFATCNDARACSACAADCASSCAPPTATAPAACGRDDAGAELVDAGGAVADAEADGGEEDDAGAEAGPTGDTCAACTNHACDRATAACAIGSECAAFLECAYACNDRACADACARSHATGKVAAVELATCAGSSCQDECGL